MAFAAVCLVSSPKPDVHRYSFSRIRETNTESTRSHLLARAGSPLPTPYLRSRYVPRAFSRLVAARRGGCLSGGKPLTATRFWQAIASAPYSYSRHSTWRCQEKRLLTHTSGRAKTLTETVGGLAQKVITLRRPAQQDAKRIDVVAAMHPCNVTTDVTGHKFFFVVSYRHQDSPEDK